MTPAKALPKELAELYLKAGKRTQGIHLSRNGISVSMVKGLPTQIPSLRDLEGVCDGRRQLIMELKTCSRSALAMEKDKLKPRQVSHMLARAARGVHCFLAIHFNARKLVRSHQPAETITIPVSGGDPRLQAFVDAHAQAKRTGEPVVSQGSISRQEAREIGLQVARTCPKRLWNALPDLGVILVWEAIK